MRSRYTAYARGDAAYIIDTTDPDGPMWEVDLPKWQTSIAAFHAQCTFGGVEILQTAHEGDEGSVRFVARLDQRGDDASFEEHSTFVRRDGQWLYHGPIS